MSRASRYLFQRDRERFISGRALLRVILSQYLGLHPAEIGFGSGRFGKPQLLLEQNEKGLRFNLSYTDGLVLMAFNRGPDVGVDIERIRPINDSLEIAGRFFHPDEQRRLSEASGDAQTSLFFNYWTRKEAYLKACGSGLSDGALARINTANFPEKQSHWLTWPGPSETGGGWSVLDFMPEPGTAGCLVLAGQPRRVVFQDAAGLIDMYSVNPFNR
jgi:4'-phosphopantetheinyl transferase